MSRTHLSSRHQVLPMIAQRRAKRLFQLVSNPRWRAPRFLKRLAWRLEKRLLQVISWFDPCSPPDSKLSLRVLWWKAVAANDISSPVFEHNGVTYDMLPSGFRILVREPLRSLLYPRWTHVIIEIRTAYLDQVIRRIRSKTVDSSNLEN